MALTGGLVTGSIPGKMLPTASQGHEITQESPPGPPPDLYCLHVCNSGFNGKMYPCCSVPHPHFSGNHTYLEESLALGDHVGQAARGRLVLFQVPLVRLAQVLFTVHHPVGTQSALSQ